MAIMGEQWKRQLGELVTAVDRTMTVTELMSLSQRLNALSAEVARTAYYAAVDAFRDPPSAGELCQCQRCGRTHKSLGFTRPPEETATDNKPEEDGDIQWRG